MVDPSPVSWYYPSGGGDGGDGVGSGGGTGSVVHLTQILAKKLRALPNPNDADYDDEHDAGGTALCGILTNKQPGVETKTTVDIDSLIMMTDTQAVQGWLRIDYEDFYEAWAVNKAHVALAIYGHAPNDAPFHSAQPKAQKPARSGGGGSSGGGSSSSSTSSHMDPLPTAGSRETAQAPPVAAAVAAAAATAAAAAALEVLVVRA